MSDQSEMITTPLEIGRAAVEQAALAAQSLLGNLWNGGDLTLVNDEAVNPAQAQQRMLAALRRIFAHAGDQEHPERPLSLQQQQALQENLTTFFRDNAAVINQTFFGGSGTPTEMSAL